MSLRENARPVLAGWRTAVVDLAIGAAAAEVAFQLRFNLRGASDWDLGPRARLAWIVVAALAVALSRLLRAVRVRAALGETLDRPSLGVDSDAALARAGFATLAVAAATFALGGAPDAIAVAILAVTTWLLLLVAERLRPRLRPWRDEVVLGIAWSVLALWWLWPLPSAWERSFGLVQRGEPLVVADSYLLAWIPAWGSHVLGTHPWRLFEAPIFFPVGSTLALSDHLLGIQPLFAPAWLATRNGVLATNATVFLSYPLGALAAYAFARRFAGRPAAAVAGTLWAFNVFRFQQVDERHMLASWGIPLALFFADRWLERGRWRDAACFACALAVQTLAAFYLAYATVLALAAFAPLALLRHRAVLDGRRLAGFALAAVAGLLPLAATSVPYLRLRAEGILPVFGGQGGPIAIGLAPGLPASRIMRWARGEGPGWVGWMLAALALVPPWRGRSSAIAIGLALVAMGVLVGVGPGGLPESLESLSPYRLLVATLPGFSTVRLPYRMVVVAQLGVALLAALGFERIGRDASPRIRPVLATVAIAAMLATQAARPALLLERETLSRDVSPAIRWLAANGDGRALLEVPGRFMISAAQRMYYGSFHWLPLVEGYSGYMPLTPQVIHRMARGLPAEATVQELVDHVDLGWILVHLGRIEPGKRAEWLGALPAGLEPVGVFGDDLVVRVDRPVREDRRARLRRGATESFGGAPLVPVAAPCPGSIRWKGPSARVEGESFEAEVEVENRSGAAWPGWAIDPRREVAVHGELVGADENVLREWTEALPEDVGPGEKLRFPVSFGQAPSAGRWRLRLGLVQAVAGDLAGCGVEGEEVGVEVREGAADRG